MNELNLQRAFYGVFVALSLVAFGAGVIVAGPEGLAFALFAVMSVGGGLMCLWERSVVRSAFALMATFTGVAGLFVLLESDFLAMAQILIYVGGILALILFGVMLSPPDMGERKLSRVLPGLAIVGVVTAWLGSEVAGTAKWAVQAGAPTGGPSGPISSAERIGVGFLAADQYVVAFELAAVVLTVALVAAVYIARRKASDLEPAPLPEGSEGEGS